MIKKIIRYILCSIMRWKVVGEFPANEKKYIIIGAPHTSNYDFIIGLIIKLTNKDTINFIGKKSLFKFPYGWFFKSLGGVPVDRKKNEKLVDAITDIFNSKKQFIFAVSPEGTRSKVNEWKTGFYYIAKQANVPIVPLTFDFKNRQTVVFPAFYTTENQKEDFIYLKSLYKGVEGKIKENSFDV